LTYTLHSSEHLYDRIASHGLQPLLLSNSLLFTESEALERLICVVLLSILIAYKLNISKRLKYYLHSWVSSVDDIL
jgi:hypothetical protein